MNETSTLCGVIAITAALVSVAVRSRSPNAAKVLAGTGLLASMAATAWVLLEVAALHRLEASGRHTVGVFLIAGLIREKLVFGAVFLLAGALAGFVLKVVVLPIDTGRE